jgi:LCP family protein required for cell wall assembly
LWSFVFLLCAGLGVGIALLLTPVGKGQFEGTIASHIRKAIEVRQDPDLIFENKPRVNLVFLGRDRDYDDRGRVMNTLGRTDTILILALEKDLKQATLVSIPRDMLVRIPGHGSQKINAAHSLGGPALTMQTLRESLGIHVDHYALFKFEGFKKAVDAVGGVDIDVPKDMEYHDNWAHLHISLKKGWQHLDGAKAHGFVRFRHDRMGDLGRIERQQTLAKTLAKKMLSPSMVFKLPSLVNMVSECLETDMTEKQLLSLAFFMQKVKMDAIKTEVLPGTWVSPYLVPQQSKSEEILARVFGNTFDKTAWDVHVAQMPSSHVRSRNSKKKKSKEEEPVNDDAIQPENISPDASSPPGSPENMPAQPVPSDGGTPPPPSGDSGAKPSDQGNQQKNGSTG